jgi:hypothetical protein
MATMDHARIDIKEVMAFCEVENSVLQWYYKVVSQLHHSGTIVMFTVFARSRSHFLFS